MNTLEFFFDLSSPWTYLAFHNVQPVVAATDARIIWRPFLVGGVFNAVNDSIYQSRENPDDLKFRHNFRWLREWALLADIPLQFPGPHHPLKSVLPMRLCCCLEGDQDALHKFLTHAFPAYFDAGRNLDDPDVLVDILQDCGMDGATLVAHASDQAIKDHLRNNTDEAIARGAYGSPTMFVNHTALYFGNDQLPLVRQALQGDQGQ